MIAISVRDNTTTEVYEYKGVLYSHTTSTALPYRIYERSYDNLDEIEYGYNYGYYHINNELYNTFISNTYKGFATQQLKLF